MNFLKTVMIPSVTFITSKGIAGMSEYRAAYPFISHLKITYHVTRHLVPSGMADAKTGQELLQPFSDRPGLEVEIIPFISEGDLAPPAPASKHTFPLRSYFEEGMESFQKLEKSEEVKKAIVNLQSILDSKEIVWCEDVLTALNLKDIADLYADVISESLDQFPSLNEANNKKLGGGIPILVKPLQCEVRFPINAPKVISVTMGMFRAKRVTKTLESGETVDEYVSIGDPNQVKLEFLDDESLKLRKRRDAELANTLLNLKNNLAAEGNTPEQIESIKGSITQTENEIRLRSIEEIGEMKQLLSKQAVQESLPVLLMAIIGALKKLIWPDLDLAITQQRIVAVLTKLIPKPEEPAPTQPSDGGASS